MAVVTGSRAAVSAPTSPNGSPFSQGGARGVLYRLFREVNYWRLQALFLWFFIPAAFRRVWTWGDRLSEEEASEWTIREVCERIVDGWFKKRYRTDIGARAAVVELLAMVSVLLKLTPVEGLAWLDRRWEKTRGKQVEAPR